MQPEQPEKAETKTDPGSYSANYERMSSFVYETPKSAEQAAQEEYRSHERRNWRVQNFINGIGAFVTFLAMCAALGGGYVALLALKASWEAVSAGREQAEIARRSYEANERSVVFFGFPRMMGLAHPDHVLRESILIEIGNSGASPTRDLTYSTACKPWNGPPEADPFDRNGLSNAKVWHIALAPKQSINPILCSYDAKELALISAAKLSIYIFGVSRYRDTMDSGKFHKVEFCLRMHDFAFSTGDAAPVGIYAVTEHCDRHNCYDEECNGEG